MTPTEQDKELDKILYVLIDSVVEARMKWHKQSQRARQNQSSNSGFSRYQSELNDADNTAKNAIKQLIIADRERVALEARTATLDALDNHKKTLNYIVKDGAPRNHTNYEVYTRKAIEVDTKIAELKAQQEEVK